MKQLYTLAITLILCCTFSPVKPGASWYSLYFTTPEISNLQENNPQNGIIKAIAEAEESFYGAFFYLYTPEIIDALVKAESEGVDIKLVLDGHFTDNPDVTREHPKKKALRTLRAAGIPVVLNEKSALMHNKFAVIDSSYVWTGSYNLSPNGAARNHNNAIKIKSQELADIFTEKFNSMYEDRVFGGRNEPPFSGFRRLFGRERYHVKINETDINVYFAPENRIESVITKRIKKSKESIHFMAFSFTSERISEAMIDRHKSGVSVHGIFERRGSNSDHSEFRKMKIEGLDVSTDSSRGAMHHKVIIIDEETVITGSYNFSINADRHNDENILIIRNRKIAEEYLQEFARLR